MGNKSLEAKKRKHKEYESYRYDINKPDDFTKEYNGVNYLLRPETIEREMHWDTWYKLIGYNTVIGDEDVDNKGELDLSFLNPEDDIRLNLDPSIKQIRLNFSNLRCLIIKKEPDDFVMELNMDVDINDATSSIKDFKLENEELDLSRVNVRIYGSVSKLGQLIIQKELLKNGFNQDNISFESADELKEPSRGKKAL